MEEKLKNEDGVFYQDYFDDTLWWVKPVYIKRDPPKLSDGTPYESYGEVIQLQWGWNAAMNESQINELDEEWQDAGFDYLTIEIENAVHLYRKLGSILRKCGAIKPTRDLLNENRELRQFIDFIRSAIEDNPDQTALQAISDMIPTVAP